MKFVIIETAAEDTSGISNNFKVSYPVNPMIKNASILYSVPCKTDVSIKLYDMTGRLIQTLENRMLDKGFYNKTINTELIGAGIYFCRLQAGNYKETKKLVLMK
ncbi:MAG: T9SS type A sorting domain-containing protein [bacterium]|nr:T9SS type A sorting domain-containing protein [bacterium]